jgi:hypothetical protein
VPVSDQVKGLNWPLGHGFFAQEAMKFVASASWKIVQFYARGDSGISGDGTFEELDAFDE